MRRFTAGLTVILAGALLASLVYATDDPSRPAQKKQACPCEKKCDCKARPCPCQDSKPKDEPAIELEGVYFLDGREKTGQRYQGAVVITSQNDNLFFSYAAPVNTAIGTGVQRGNHIAVTWKASDIVGRQLLGVTIYAVEKKGKLLHGDWRPFPAGEVREESLHFLRALDKDQPEARLRMPVGPAR